MVLPRRQSTKKVSGRTGLEVVKAHCKSFRKRLAAAKAKALKQAHQAQKAASSIACRLVRAKLEAYQEGLKARKVTGRKQQLEAYGQDLQAKKKACRKRIAAGKLKTIQNIQHAQQAESRRESRKRIVATRVEAYQTGQDAQKKASDVASKKHRLKAYHEGLQEKKLAFSKVCRKRVAAAKLEAYRQAQKELKAQTSRACSKRIAAEVCSLQAKKVAFSRACSKRIAAEVCSLQAKKVAFSKTARKRIAAARLEAYTQAQAEQKAKSSKEIRKAIEQEKLEADQQLQKVRQVARKRVAAAKLAGREEAQKALETASTASGRRLAAAKAAAYEEARKALEANGYEEGVSRGARQQSKPARGSKRPIRNATVEPYGMMRPDVQQVCLEEATDSFAPCTPKRGCPIQEESPSKPWWPSLVAKPGFQAPLLAPKVTSPRPSDKGALCALATPLRKRSAAHSKIAAMMGTIAPFRPTGAKHTSLVRPLRKPAPVRSTADSSAELLWRLDVKASASSSSADMLETFLNEGVTRSGAFKLRLRQVSEATCAEGFGEVAVVEPPKEIDIIVDGKCSLVKLNQLLTGIFDTSEEVFATNKKSTTVPGSHFAVSRPLEHGRCNKVVLSSEASAARIGSGSNFVNDRSYCVSQLFRGMSTSARVALGEPEEEAHEVEVIFASPSMSTKVDVSLYDFVGSRHGKKPLSQIVRSSFLDAEEIQGKNIMIQAFL